MKYAELLSLPDCPVDYVGESALLDQNIPEICIDSRQSLAGGLYVALRGERHDGHKFVAGAMENGAIAAVVDSAGLAALTEKPAKNNFFIVENTLHALQEIAAYYRQQFSIPVLGITGTSGKTTTKEMLAAILSTRYAVHKTAGNLNNLIGVPLTLLRLTPQHEFAIIEMGTNHFGEIERLTQIARPDSALITNIGRGHLEFLENVAGVAREKTALFQGLSETGRIFVNIDDVHLKPFSTMNRDSVTFGMAGNADYLAKPLAQDSEGKWKIEIAGTEIQLSLPGRHNIYNALAAAAVAGSYGVSMQTVKIALEGFRAHDKRMQVLQAGGVTIINDTYNANPDSTTAALRVLAEWQCSGKKIAVLADMLELGTVSMTEHQNIGQTAVELGLDMIWGFGPRTKVLIETARLTVDDRARHFENKTALIDELKKTVTSGDVVLIKGSRGMAMEEVTCELVSNKPEKEGQTKGVKRDTKET